MAARMSERSTQRKEDYLDWLHEKFCASSKLYVSAVKAALRSQVKENVADIFERAIDVLSQDFPDPTSIDEQTKKEEGGDGNELNSLKDRIAQVEMELKEAQNKSSMLEQELKSVKEETQAKCSTLESNLESVKEEAQAKCSTLESNLESVKEEAQAKCSTLESNLESVKEEAQVKCSILESELNSEMKKNIRRLDAKIGSLKNNVETVATETKDSIKELTEVSDENSASIKGLRKLQVLLKERTQVAAAAATTTAAAVTPPPTAPTASALSRPLKDVRQRTNFSAKVSTDKLTPEIRDVKLVAGGRLVLADRDNKCIKLFDSQGQHLHTLECRGYPFRLAVIDSSGLSNCHTFAVTLPYSHGIDIIEAGGDKMKVVRTLPTTKQYFAVAALNKHTLAAGYLDDAGIDLLDSDGRVLRQICSSVQPWCMDITEDGGLVCSTKDYKLARVQEDTGSVVFHKSDPQIMKPCGVASAPDGSVIVTNRSNRSFHLVSSQGTWIKQLWSVPSGDDQDDELWRVSMDGWVCVTVTHHGSVYMFDCVY